MGKGRRWQPPHPDPSKAPPPNPAAKVIDRAFERATTWHRDCAWRDCPKPQSIRLNIPLCDAHAQIAHDEVEAVTKLRTQATEQRREERQQAIAQSTADINAGRRPTNGFIPGWVYYIQVDDTIKIGYAKSIRSRMRAYPPSARLLAAEPGTKKIEAQRHDHFHAYLAHGREWFRDVPEIREWIATLVAEYGKPDSMAYRYTTPHSGQHVTAPRDWTGRRRTA